MIFSLERVVWSFPRDLQGEKAYSSLIEDSQPSRYSNFQKFKGAMRTGIPCHEMTYQNWWTRNQRTHDTSATTDIYAWLYQIATLHDFYIFKCFWTPPPINQMPFLQYPTRSDIHTLYVWIANHISKTIRVQPLYRPVTVYNQNLRPWFVCLPLWQHFTFVTPPLTFNPNTTFSARSKATSFANNMW